MAIRKDLDKGTLEKLQKFFGIKVNKNAKTASGVIEPRDTVLTKDETSLEYVTKEMFPPQIQRLYHFWITTYFNVEKYNKRTELWSDMENLYYNDPLIARAVKIKTDEVVQADSNMQPIFVEGDKAQVDYLLEFYDNTQLYSKIWSTAFDINLFGNHAWILGVNGDKGIDEIIQPDIFALTERLEFYPAELEAEIAKTGGSSYKQYFSQDRVKQLIDAITNKDNITSVHKRYLLGFIINNYILPPWRVLHFRNFTTRSPFSPFGVPGFIHSLAPYKQYDAAMTFQVMARAASFPIDKYELNLPNIMDDSEKFSTLLNFIEKLDNLGLKQAKKEDRSLGDRIFTIKELFDFDQISPDIDIGKIADIDMLRDERIISTGLPRNIVDPNDSGFGDSGVALIQKWKELARSVFHTQHIILDNITQLSKLQMILTKSFSAKDFNFILSMPFPESQNNSEILDSQKDILDLFVAITDTLSDKFMGGESLPDDLKKEILMQVMPYDQQRVDNWIKSISKEKKRLEKEGIEIGADVEGDVEEETDDGGWGFDESYKRFKENVKTKTKMPYREAIEKEIINTRQLKMREGKLNQKHYFSSKNTYADFRAENLVDFEKQVLKEMDLGFKIDDDVFLTNKDGSKIKKI